MDNLSAITIYTHGHGVRVRVRLEEFCQEADRGKEIMTRQGDQPTRFRPKLVFS